MVTAKRLEHKTPTDNKRAMKMDFEYKTTDLPEAQIPLQIAPVSPVLEPAAIAGNLVESESNQKD